MKTIDLSAKEEIQRKCIKQKPCSCKICASVYGVMVFKDSYICEDCIGYIKDNIQP